MVAKTYLGEIQNIEPHKCDDLSWFKLDNLPKNIVDYVSVALGNYQNNVTYSEFGY